MNFDTTHALTECPIVMRSVKHFTYALSQPMADELLTIGDLAARTGVSASALWYYEHLGIVRPARRE